MSLSQKVVGTCSKCAKSLEITVWDSINTDLFPDVPQKIISGELFKIICSHCGAELHIEYPTLYHDMKHNVMIKIMSNDSSPQEEISEINKVFDGIDRVFKGYVTRLVKNTRELSEKVEIIEAGLDDRVIEIIKVISLAQVKNIKPGFEVKNCFFEIRNGEKKLKFYNNQDDCVVTAYNEEGYINVERALLNVNKEFPTQNFAIIDINWAQEMIEVLDRMNNSESSKVSPEEIDTLKETLSTNCTKHKTCSECGEKLIGDSEFCNKCGKEAVHVIDQQKSKYEVCIFDTENKTLRKEIREIDIIKFPPLKYTVNGTYYAIETIRDGKKVRIYHVKKNWEKQIESSL